MTYKIFVGASAPDGFPGWAKNTSLYRGTFRKDGKTVKCMKRAELLASTKSGVVTPDRSGAVTATFMAALLRAAQVQSRPSFDGYGTNSKYAIGEFTNVGPWVGPLNSDVKTAPTPTVIFFSRETRSFMIADNGEKNPEDGIASGSIPFSLWGLFMESDEFKNYFLNFCAELKKQPADEAGLQECAVLMADCAYFMVTDSRNVAYIPNIENVAVSKIGCGTIQNKAYKATFWVGKSRTGVDRMAVKQGNDLFPVEDDEFSGYFSFGHALSEDEKKNVPVLPNYEHPTSLARAICAHIKASTNMTLKFRNFMLYGPTGTGKSTIARHVAAGVNLPYGSLNCNTDSTVLDLLCQCMPASREGSPLKVKSPVGVPDVDTMLYDPATAWKQLTGESKEVSPERCMSLAYERLTGEAKEISASEYMSYLIKTAVKDAEKTTGQSFIYVESPLVKAARYGWVCEIQEPSTIVQGGVLPGLNSLLDDNGQIFLPSGEIVHRHPDCVVIATTNLNYEGCRDMNESFLRRFRFKAIVEMPPREDALKRIKDMIGYSENDFVTTKQIRLMMDCADQIKEQCIRDFDKSAIGLNEVAAWAASANMCQSVLGAAEWTILPSATQEHETLAKCRQIIENKFKAGLVF